MARLQMERERLEREHEKTEAEVVTQFEHWAKNPAVREWMLQDWISPEEHSRRIREIYGLPPEPVAEVVTTAPSQIQSN